jgi:hypothetical protein
VYKSKKFIYHNKITNLQKNKKTLVKKEKVVYTPINLIRRYSMDNSIVTWEPREGGRSIGRIREKELIHAYQVVDFGDTDKRGARVAVALVDCQLYMGRSSGASTVYCVLWIHHAGVYATGTGMAGGYGYDKQSAAVASAINSAGITLARSISGVGPDAVRSALLAIADYMGAKDARLVVAYA